MLSIFLPTHHIPKYFTTNMVGTCPNFATFPEQLRTYLLRKWLEAAQGALLIPSACVFVTYTLTTGLSGMQRLQEYCSSLLTLWTVWYQVLLLMLE